MKSSLLALNRFVLIQGPQKLTGAPAYCLWKSDSLFLSQAWQSLQRGRPGAFSYIWFSMLAYKKSVKATSFYLLVSVTISTPAHYSGVLMQHTDMQETKSSQLVYLRYVGVYTLHASCVPGKYVNILSME